MCLCGARQQVFLVFVFTLLFMSLRINISLCSYVLWHIPHPISHLFLPLFPDLAALFPVFFRQCLLWSLEGWGTNLVSKVKACHVIHHYRCDTVLCKNLEEMTMCSHAGCPRRGAIAVQVNGMSPYYTKFLKILDIVSSFSKVKLLLKGTNQVRTLMPLLATF